MQGVEASIGGGAGAATLHSGAAAAAAARQASLAALQAVQEELQLQAAAFCEQHPDLAEGAKDLRRATALVSPPGGGPNVSFHMWVYDDHDFVSGFINDLGGWEPFETGQMLTKLAAFQQACIACMRSSLAARPLVRVSYIVFFLQSRGLAASEVYLLDVGANVGWHGLVAAAMGYQVIGFEPMDKNIACIRRTLCENPDMQKRYLLFTKVGETVTPYYCIDHCVRTAPTLVWHACLQGLSDSPSKCSFYVDPANSGNGNTGCGADARNATMGR